jgi:hypothetical protein
MNSILNRHDLLRERFAEEGNLHCSHSAMKEHSAGNWSRSAIWPGPAADLCKMVGGNRPVADFRIRRKRSLKTAESVQSPSLNRTPCGMPRMALISFWAMCVTPQVAG